ncbi:MAG: response regulator [Nitrososphaera sp.]|nr:response regulator [Candidatus Nitrosotalea sinensis]
MSLISNKNDVLVIEDSLATTLLLRDFLKKLGYENVETCNSGKTGINLFSELERAGKNPIVLLDFHLPDMDANEVMTQIFNIKPDAKIILETADSKSDEPIKNALRSGAYLYIEKPIRYENLKNIFETLEQEKSILEEKPSDNTSVILSHMNSLKNASLARLAESIGVESNLIEKYLLQLENEKKIIKTYDVKEISCIKCNSVRISLHFFCPSCGNYNFGQGKLIEHFKCGNVSTENSYKENKCPKCKKEIKILGVDYKTMDNYYICNDCNNKFSEPSQNYVCAKCGNIFQLENAHWITSTGYKII